MSNISLLDIEKVKREAKKIKKQFPNLSHSQLLDQASMDVLNVRNYHEALKNSKSHVNSFVDQDGNLDKYTYCELLFLKSEKSDEKDHEKMHLEYEKVEGVFGFVPAGMDEREKGKELAHRELSRNNSDEIQMRGALRLMKAYFDRSLADSINAGNWKKHPKFEIYIAMLDLSDIFSTEIMKTIRNKYGKKDGIDKGLTYWHM